jgi:hypothetical protein
MVRLVQSTLFSLFLLLLSCAAHAQSIPGITDPIIFKVSPEFPKPNSEATIEAQSYSTDLDRATFTWYVNGKSFRKGTGLKSITIPTGPSGAKVSVSADIVTTDIGTISYETAWRSADVSLAWQTDGYIPPFYKGKALESYGSAFIVSAIPEFLSSNGRRLDPKTLVYTWKKNNTVDPQQSGRGNDRYIGNQSSFVRGGDTISVEVSTDDRGMSASNSVTLSPLSPEVLFYENSPLYGLRSERALSSPFYLSVEELALKAEPYYVSVGRELSDLLIDWSLNDVNVAGFSGKTEIVVRSNNTPGRSDIGFTLQHSTKPLQGAKAMITIIQ